MSKILKFTMPKDMERIETQPIQFGDKDWPGIFIRGDHALVFSHAISNVLMAMEKSNINELIIYNHLEGLIETLESCDVNVIRRKASDDGT